MKSGAEEKEKVCAMEVLLDSVVRQAVCERRLFWLLQTFRNFTFTTRRRSRSFTLGYRIGGTESLQLLSMTSTVNTFSSSLESLLQTQHLSILHPERKND
jgi:hypothetical protein